LNHSRPRPVSSISPSSASLPSSTNRPSNGL
jgi:hypothetical protein